MPLRQHTPNPIRVRVNDVQVAETIVCQEGECTKWSFTQAGYGGGPALEIEVLVRAFAKNGDALGPELLSGPFRARMIPPLTADNRTLVVAATGTQLAVRTPTMSDAEWQAVIDGFPQETDLQGNYFERLREEVLPVSIGDLIRFHMHAAIAAGRYNG